MNATAAPAMEEIVDAVLAHELPETYVTEDGYEVRSSDGEVLRYVGAPGEPAARAEFRIHDRASAEWVLAKKADKEAQVEAIKKRREVLLANMDKQLAQAQAKVDRIDHRFAEELIEWTKEQLANGKAKSMQFDNGKVASRATGERYTVTDEAAAIEWAEANDAAHLVKVKKMIPYSAIVGLVTDLQARSKDLDAPFTEQELAQETAPFLAVVPAKTTWTITTGINRS